MSHSRGKQNKNNDLYAVLGCPKSASTEQIMAEYRVKALSMHPDKIVNESQNVRDEATERFQELQFAKDVLSNPQKRAHYDLWLAMGSMEFDLETWMENQGKIQQTLHWGNKREQGQLTKAPSKGSEADFLNAKPMVVSSWEPHESPTAKAFRNYRL